MELNPEVPIELLEAREAAIAERAINHPQLEVFMNLAQKSQRVRSENLPDEGLSSARDLLKRFSSMKTLNERVVEYGRLHRDPLTTKLAEEVLSIPLFGACYLAGMYFEAAELYVGLEKRIGFDFYLGLKAVWAYYQCGRNEEAWLLLCRCEAQVRKLSQAFQPKYLGRVAELRSLLSNARTQKR